MTLYDVGACYRSQRLIWVKHVAGNVIRINTFCIINSISKQLAREGNQSINQMFISSNHPLGCSKDKKTFAGPPTTWEAHITVKKVTFGEQVDHNGATQYAVWRNMLIAGGVEKVKRQWLQLKPDQASWAQNSDMELVSR